MGSVVTEQCEHVFPSHLSISVFRRSDRAFRRFPWGSEAVCTAGTRPAFPASRVEWRSKEEWRNRRNRSQTRAALVRRVLLTS